MHHPQGAPKNDLAYCFSAVLAVFVVVNCFFQADG